MAHEIQDILTEDELARELAAQGPPGWERVDAVFAITVAAELGQLVYVVGDRAIALDPPESVLRVVRSRRALDAGTGAGPWWRMLVVLSDSGDLRVDHDYGDDPFPDGQLFDPETYRADLAEYPRERLPVWLAAYVNHGDRQLRSPQQAAAQARTDRERQVWARLSAGEFPPFATMWARWAAIAAAFVAAGSGWGPRLVPWTATFEGTARGGSTLCVLPGGRAVLSGGVWNAPALDAAYNGGGRLPELYAGAPDWVADPVLNSRAATGLLSFCYWWDAGHWYRGDSPSAAECASAVPGMWTHDTVVDIITGLLTGATRDSVSELLTAAAAGRVHRAHLTEMCGTEERFDIDGALYQFAAAGLTASGHEPMPRAEAITRVRDFIQSRGLDTTGYPLAELSARRFDVGWMVYVPMPDGELMIGRAIFYVADDGVLEQSSSSVAPEIYITEFEQRYSERHGVTA